MTSPIRRSHLHSFSRLALIGALIITGASLGQVAFLPEAEACRKIYVPRDPRPTLSKNGARWEVKLGLYSRYFRFAGSYSRLQNLFVFTRNERMARYLSSLSSSRELWTAIQPTLKRFTCADLLDGKRLAVMERAVGKAIARYYLSKTRRRARQPDVMLSIYAGYNFQCNPPATP